MSNKPMREQFPDIAKCVDDLRAMGFTITGACVHDEHGRLLAGRVPIDPPGEVILPAERVIAMQVWARSAAPEVAKMAPKRKGKR
jgi:hypothetical protein